MLYFVTWLTDFSVILFVFAGPRYMAETKETSLVMGLLGALFFVASGSGNALSGRLADRVGLKRVSMSGAGTLFIVLSVLAWVPVPKWFHFASYALVGFGVGCVYPPIMAWLGKTHSRANASAAFLRFGLAFNFGILCAQLGGGLLYDYVATNAPYVAASLATLVSLVCLSALNESPSKEQTQGLAKEPSDKELRDVVRAQGFVKLSWLANLAGMFSMSIVWFMFPRLAVALDVSAERQGMILAIGRALVMVTYAAMHFHHGWRYRFRIAFAFQFGGFVGLTCLGFASAPLTLSLGIGLLSVMMGFNYFASLYYNTIGSSDEKKGAAYGLNEALLAVGACGGSTSGGLIIAWEFSEHAPYQIGAAVIMIVLILQTIVYQLQARNKR